MSNHAYRDRGSKSPSTTSSVFDLLRPTSGHVPRLNPGGDDAGHTGFIRSTRGLLVLEPSTFSHRWHEIEPHLNRVPPIEADILEMRFRSRLSLAQIATIFERASHSTICYLIDRAVARIRFLISLPAVSNDQLADAVSSVSPDNVELCVLLSETTSATQTAQRLGITHTTIWRRRNKVIELMRVARRTDPMRYTRPLKLLVMLRDNSRILSEYRQPSHRPKKKRRSA